MIWRAVADWLAALLARWWHRFVPRRPALSIASPVLALPAPVAAIRAPRTPLELPAVIALPGPPPTPPAPSQARRRPHSVARLKRDVLEKLDAYQIYIRRLKKYDPQAYHQYRRLGAYICHPDHEAAPQRLEPALAQTLPAFGALAFGIGRDTEVRQPGDDPFVPVRFAYFTRLARPGNDIERVSGGVTYRCHLYWDDTKDAKINERGLGYGRDIVVNVLPDGTVRALRMLKVSYQTIRSHQGGTVERMTSRGRYKTRKTGAPNVDHITHQRWGLPDVWDLSLRQTAAHWKGRSLSDYITEMFCLLANFWLAAARQSMIRVTATKDSVVMPFVVDVTQTPAFFRDREPVIVDGVKRRIFHVVRAHTRVRGNVRRGVRLHFAGLRAFTWNGYAIAITVPGRDHVDLADASFGGLEDMTPEEMAADPDLIDLPEMAERMAEHIGAPAAEEREGNAA